MDAPDDFATPPRASFVTRTGTLLGAGLLASFACGLFVAARGSGAFGPRLLIATAMTAPVATLLVILFARARDGLRIVASDESSAIEPSLVGAFGLAGPVLAALGYVLAAKTHQHALAGATYAIGALLVCIAAVMVAHRIAVAALAPVRDGEAANDGAHPANVRRVVVLARAGAVLGFALPLLAAAMRMPGASRDAAVMAALDCALLLATTWVGSGLDFAGRRAFARAAVPVWILVALVGSRLNGTLVQERVPTTLGALAPWVR